MTVLVDGTMIFGDFSSLCGLSAFNGFDYDGEDIIVADCGDTGRQITGCSCCNVTVSNDGCSNPLVAHLDYRWEMDDFVRRERDFEVNKTHVHAPDE